MNFAEFQTYRAARLAAAPGLVDLAETNLWRSLTDAIPLLSETPEARVHRCHLARDWLTAFGLSESLAARAFVSRGVRDSLARVFAVLARQGARLAIPEDVYPVYGQLADAAGLSYTTFATVPEPTFPDDVEWLLLPNPLKPLGRWLSPNEVASLCSWLAADSRRRLLLDAVYAFDTRWHRSTRALWDTKQTIVLHSLSKGWLRPKVFGVALTPEADADLLAPSFREDPPSQAQLHIARQLLNEHATLPEKVASILAERRGRMLASLPESIRAELETRASGTAGYLVAVQASHEQLRERHGVLSIPLTVFGSQREDICVLSSLGMVDRAVAP